MNRSGSFINAIGTAVPENEHAQPQLARFMANALQLDEPARRRMGALYRQTKISRRYSVLPDYSQTNGAFTFYPNTPDLEPFPSVGQRMAVYKREAMPLALRAVRDCLASYPAFAPESVTHLIVVSCTGFYAPGPDIELVEALGLPGTTQRLLIGFMGCYGAFNGLKAADAIVRADPQANVLVVCVELCTIHFQKSNDVSNWLANALFGDGAAAVLVQGQARPEQSFQLQSFQCDLLPEGRDEMAWTIGNQGFDMVLSQQVPDLIRHHVGHMLHRILNQNELSVDDIDYFALHPGGRRILDLIETELVIDRTKTRHAYDVLEQYGNMSSATVLFVLKAIWNELADAATRATDPLPDGFTRTIAGVAFGPGLTLESMLLVAQVEWPVTDHDTQAAPIELVDFYLQLKRTKMKRIPLFNYLTGLAIAGLVVLTTTAFHPVDGGKPPRRVEKSEAEWKKILSPDVFAVTRQQGTERPYTSPLASNHEHGEYRCVGCHEPLFQSETKFESGTGWPSFYAPISKNVVKELRDSQYGMVRTEVQCAVCDAHLGHVFNDGPKPTGLRYCMNGVALEFVRK